MRWRNVYKDTSSHDNRRAEPVKQAASHYVCQEQQLNYPGVCWVHHWHSKTISSASGAQTHILMQTPVSARGKALKWEGRDIHRMNYCCERSDHTYICKDNRQPLRTHWWLIIMSDSTFQSEGKFMNELFLWRCDSSVQVKRVPHMNFGSLHL